MSTPRSAVALARSPKPGKKYFGIPEADRALVYVRPVVSDLMSCYRRVVDIRRHIEKPADRTSREHLEADYERAMDKLSELVDELHMVGVELKDFERGLVDFPAIHDDREIYLCWEYGEEHVGNWHETDAGYASRQDVATLATPAHDRAA